MTSVQEVSWELAQLTDLVNELGRRARILPRGAKLAPPPHDASSPWRWLGSAAQAHGVEIEPVGVRHNDVDALLRGAGPAVLEWHDERGRHYLGLLRASRGRLDLLALDRRVRRVPLRTIRALLCRPVEAPHDAQVDELLELSSVRGARRRRARRDLMERSAAGALVGGAHHLRFSPGASFAKQIVHEGIARRVLRLVGLELAFSGLFLASWWLIGRGALTGRIEQGWFAAWVLVLLTLVPIRLMADWTQAALAVAFGGLLRRRLLLGALHMAPDEVRRLGAGAYLAQSLESQALERFGIAGGFLGLIAVLELALAALVLSLGGGGSVHALLLGLWCVPVVALGWSVHRRRAAWTDARLHTSNRLTEKMVGYRTRLAQQPRSQWHVEEDGQLASLVELACALDQRTASLRALVVRGWTVVGLAALAPGWIDETLGPAGLAIGVGGVLFAAQAFQSLALSIEQLVTAAVSWRALQRVFRAAAESEHGDARQAVAPVSIESGAAAEDGLLHLDRVSFGYANRAGDVLSDLCLTVNLRDRILVEGPSGGGKSTFVALLLGLRRPRSGLVLLRGFDSKTIGLEEWRRRVVGVPQFNDNHVLSASLAFNLLMGRGWPPSSQDLARAEATCRELGLGELLDRMPGGLLQVVGETGWQLSHGERTRVYLARALLQEPDVLVLDEAFAALDPDNLQRTIAAVRKRPAALVAIAHP